jgi:hypothetical protein
MPRNSDAPINTAIEKQSWYVVENKRALILPNKAGMCPSFYHIPALTKNKAELKIENWRLSIVRRLI